MRTPELLILCLQLPAILAAVWVTHDARRRSIDPLPWAVLTLFLPLVGGPLYWFRVVRRVERMSPGT